MADITYPDGLWLPLPRSSSMQDPPRSRLVQETHVRTDLVLQALGMALGQRRPEAVNHHFDQGAQ